MAAYAWKSNAHMLADLFDVMGRPSGPWVDLTFGEKGAWWNAPNIAPDNLVMLCRALTLRRRVTMWCVLISGPPRSLAIRSG
jgi:hypothetical protein